MNPRYPQGLWGGHPSRDGLSQYLSGQQDNWNIRQNYVKGQTLPGVHTQRGLRPRIVMSTNFTSPTFVPQRRYGGRPSFWSTRGGRTQFHPRPYRPGPIGIHQSQVQCQDGIMGDCQSEVNRQDYQNFSRRSTGSRGLRIQSRGQPGTHARLQGQEQRFQGHQPHFQGQGHEFEETLPRLQNLRPYPASRQRFTKRPYSGSQSIVGKLQTSSNLGESRKSPTWSQIQGSFRKSQAPQTEVPASISPVKTRVNVKTERSPPKPTSCAASGSLTKSPQGHGQPFQGRTQFSTLGVSPRRPVKTENTLQTRNTANLVPFSPNTHKVSTGVARNYSGPSSEAESQSTVNNQRSLPCKNVIMENTGCQEAEKAIKTESDVRSSQKTVNLPESKITCYREAVKMEVEEEPRTSQVRETSNTEIKREMCDVPQEMAVSEQNNDSGIVIESNELCKTEMEVSDDSAFVVLSEWSEEMMDEVGAALNHDDGLHKGTDDLEADTEKKLGTLNSLKHGVEVDNHNSSKETLLNHQNELNMSKNVTELIQSISDVNINTEIEATKDVNLNSSPCDVLDDAKTLAQGDVASSGVNDEKTDEKKSSEKITDSTAAMFESFSEDWKADLLEEEEEDDDDLLAEPAHLRKASTLAVVAEETPSTCNPGPSTSKPPEQEENDLPLPTKERDVIGSESAECSDDEKEAEITAASPGKRKREDVGNDKNSKMKNYSLDSLLMERKETEHINRELKEMRKGLQLDINAGGIDKMNFSNIEVSVDQLCPEYRKHLNQIDIREETIKEMHSGEVVFRPGKYKCLFSYPDTLRPADCGVTGNSFMDQHLNTLPSDMLLEFIGGEFIVLTFRKITKGHKMLDWLFYLMSIHPKSLVGMRCHHALSELLFLGTASAATWWPGPRHLATVLINYGADLQSLPSCCIDPSFTEENLKFPDDKENSNNPDRPAILREEDLQYKHENFHNVLYILTEACSKRKNLVKDEEVSSLIIMLLKISLDQTLITSTLRHDIMVCVAALLEAASTDGWKDVVLKLSKNVPLLTSHHHNRLSLVQLLPPSGRCEYLRRRLAYAVLQKVLWNSFVKEEVSNLKVRFLLPCMEHLSSMGTSKNIDFYLMSSVIRLTDLAVGNETLPSSEKDDINLLTEKMRGLISDVKDFVNIMDRTVVKDLMHRILSKWTFMAQNMGKKQGTIFAWATQASQKVVSVDCSQNEDEKLEMESEN